MIWCFSMIFILISKGIITAFGQKIILPMVIVVHQNYIRVPGGILRLTSEKYKNMFTH